MIFPGKVHLNLNFPLVIGYPSQKGKEEKGRWEIKKR
jgi:hypothetical protein